MASRWPEPPQLRRDLRACRAQLSAGSRTFLAASYLLPRAVREPACALYAFCREADDAVDLGGDPGAAVDRLRRRLDRLYAGAPEAGAADRALAHVVARHAIPRPLLDALIEGFEWDSRRRRYGSIEALQAYAARVAGSVGAMMALLMGARSPAALARACELGVAMQLSNIARDVGEDAGAGRLYLPLDWLHEAGIDAEAWLAEPRFTPALAAVVQRLLDHAQTLYRRVDAGVAALPLGCRPGINAARFLYAEIGREVARRGFDSVSQRAVVGAGTKSLQLARALLQLAPARTDAELPPLAATEYLVRAVAEGPAPAPLARPRTGTYQRLLWTLELFEQLERRERQPAGWALPGSAGAGGD
ncbi:MAG: phytoene/squalene synthase family protein [Burkholderiales bacterium]|nr:phytoene/squalene synthase family protein [Burkholderiales bacterium]